MNQSQNLWFREPIESVLEKLNSSKTGLDAAQAQERLTQYGPNELQGGSADFGLGHPLRTIQKHSHHHSLACHRAFDRDGSRH
jgi:hypothetical protein